MRKDDLTVALLAPLLPESLMLERLRVLSPTLKMSADRPDKLRSRCSEAPS